MSGFNPKTGIFELTETKARYWLRRPPYTNPYVYIPNVIPICINLFKEHNLPVLHNGGSFLRVKATPEQIWEVLSGQPSDPKRASYYYK